MALALGAMAQAQPEIIPFKVGMNAYLNGMNRNGTWATFQYQSGEDLPLTIRVWDLSNGKPVDYTPEKLINWQGKAAQFPEGAYSQVHGISADGMTIVGTSSGQPAYFTVADKTWHELSLGSASLNRNGLGEAYSVSDDGRVVAGWYSKGTSMTELGGCVWKDGELMELTNLPDYLDLVKAGILDREKYEEKKGGGETPSYTFRQLDATGTKVLGAIDHNQPGWGCCYYVYDLENNTYQFILPEGNKLGGFTESAAMSPDGRYVTGTYMYIENDWDDVAAPFLFDTATGTMELYTGPLDVQVLPTAVDNNGVIYGATPGNLPMRRVMVKSGTLWVDLMKTLDQKFGIDFTEATGFELSGYFTAVNGEGNIAVAQAAMRDECFVIKMPETFLDATKEVSLLNDYLVSPEKGMKFSHLKTMMLRFSYSALPVESAKVYVESQDRVKVAETSDIQSQGSQNILYEINFGDVALNADVQYTVVIPAGTFKVPDTDMTNNEIRVTYTGREDVPVKPVSYTPAEGANVLELSYSSPVKITFDCPLTLGNAVKAELYEEGRTGVLSTMAASAEGRVLTLYPTADRKLSKDKQYTLKVPAGLVADIGQAGANEAFEIHYTGTYVPTFTPTGNYAFFDDFDDPAASLGHFLMYEGDHRQPTDQMQGWGFDADNTPWNFSVRDSEGTYDYVAASHSMFTTPGTADDWMSLPQVYLPNDKYFLTFDALRLDKNKADKLDIYVWESDDVLGSLDKTTVDKMKAEAVKLATVAPMAAPDGSLAGAWDHFEIPLASFSGKKVYIAFVNANENQSALFVNNLGVLYSGDFTLTDATEKSVVAEKSAPVRVGVQINNDVNFSKVEAALTSGDFRSAYTATGLSLTKGDTHAFTFPEELPLTIGSKTRYTVSVKLDGVEQVFTSEIADHSFEVNKRVLIEEGTGTWCGNCPLGEVAIEHLEETMGDNVAIISVHNDDRMKLDEYDQFLALGAYPKGRVNRRADVYQPMCAPDDNPTGDYDFVSPEGNQTFKDAVLSEMSSGAEAEIKISDAVYYSADGILDIPVEVRFSLNQENVPYYVFTAIVEDGLEYDQTNYFSGNASKVMGWWAAQEGKVKWSYRNVARDVMGGFMGVDGRVPMTTVANEIYRSEGKMTMPGNVKNADNMHFVAALIDARTGRVVNSDVCREFTVNSTPGAGVEEMETVSDIVPVVTVEQGMVLINGVKAQIWTIEGRSTANSSLTPGIYVARAIVGGKALTAKVVVK